MESIPLEHVRLAARTRPAERLVLYVCILLGALILGLDGIGRSLWLDEAWVANSVREPSLRGMFYYPDWLQTSPPLFLVIARAVTDLLGFSTAALRTVPLLFQFFAAAGMLTVARRVATAPVALLATALLVFHPLPVEYFRSFKQYGAEVAATTALLLAVVMHLQSPGRREYLWLLAAATLLLPLSYPLAFLLPGVVLAVWFSGPDGNTRAAALAGVSAAMLAVLYTVFIRHNVDPTLWTFWSNDPDPRYGGGTAVISIVTAMAVYAGWRMTKGMTWREWTLAICLLPCALLLLAEVSGWYPASPRTRLFLRPCFLLALALIADDLLVWVADRWRQAQVAVTLAAVVVMGWGLRKHFTEGRGRPTEDYIAAIHFLHRNVAPGEVLLVHPAAREGYRLYTELENWRPPVIYGNTGWPCCAREHAAGPRSSSEEAVKQDMDTKIPGGKPLRIWLLYPSRGTHWEYTGLNEGDLWRRLLTERGCQPGKSADPLNLVLLEMECPAATADRKLP